MLQQIPLIGDEVPPTAAPLAGHDNAVPVNAQEPGLPTPRAYSATLLGAGLPPILAKLVSRIEAGQFIHMAELLPERLDPTRTLFTDKPEPVKSNRRRKTVTSILEWIQCFACNTLQEIPRETTRHAQLSYLDNSKSHGI